MSNHCTQSTMITHHNQVNGAVTRRDNRAQSRFNALIARNIVIYRHRKNLQTEETIVGIFMFLSIMAIQVFAYYYII